jgi:TRAP-type C4-dicarboxylate transport system permease small subunit
MLVRYRHRLLEVDVRFELGFLYEAFVRTAWYFELIDTLNKLFMTSVIPFFSPNLQLPMGLGCTLIYTVIILLKKPYRLKGDDRLHLLVQAVIFMMLTTGYVLVSTNTNVLEEKLDLLLSLMLIAMTCGLVLVFLVQFARKARTALFQQVQTWRKSWLQVKDATADEITDTTAKPKEKPDQKDKSVLPVTNPLFGQKAGDDVDKLLQNADDSATSANIQKRSSLLAARLNTPDGETPGPITTKRLSIKTGDPMPPKELMIKTEPFPGPPPDEAPLPGPPETEPPTGEHLPPPPA